MYQLLPLLKALKIFTHEKRDKTVLKLSEKFLSWILTLEICPGQNLLENSTFIKVSLGKCWTFKPLNNFSHWYISKIRPSSKCLSILIHPFCSFFLFQLLFLDLFLNFFKVLFNIISLIFFFFGWFFLLSQLSLFCLTQYIVI